MDKDRAPAAYALVSLGQYGHCKGTVAAIAKPVTGFLHYSVVFVLAGVSTEAEVKIRCMIWDREQSNFKAERRGRGRRSAIERARGYIHSIVSSDYTSW